MKRLRDLLRQLLLGERLTLVLWIYPIIGILILFLIPFLLTRNGFEVLNYSKTGQIGDTIGGIAGPIIALIAALLTFLAFWIQVQANKIQTFQFSKQDIDTKIDRFENKFYELLKLHRDNVSEIEIENKVFKRKAFPSMFKEFKFAYHSLKQVYKAQLKLGTLSKTPTEQDLVEISYFIFFMGVGESSDKLTIGLIRQHEESLISNFIEYLKRCQGNYKKEGSIAIDTENNTVFTLNIKYKPFAGHISRLGHYYRHLFQTVKFVVEYNPSIIENKDDYLRTIRAQLSSHEQLLLYYNGLSTLGKPWIENNYFTDYRMIKNLPLPLADISPKPKDKLGEKNRKNEPLFESHYY